MVAISRSRNVYRYNKIALTGCISFIMLVFVFKLQVLTLNLLTATIVAPPSNASKWQMGFNSAFKWLI